MIKRFVNGLVAGAGFGVAFVLVIAVGLRFAIPSLFDEAEKKAQFSNPKEAKLVTPNFDSDSIPNDRYSFFNHSNLRLEIPESGGILGMSLAATPDSAKRVSTYQLWLTQSELWQIRTTGDKAEIEKLPYPEGASADTLDSLMTSSVGYALGRSTMIVSAREISELKKGNPTSSSRSLNGELRITVEGVVFVLPNPSAT